VTYNLIQTIEVLKGFGEGICKLKSEYTKVLEENDLEDEEGINV